MSYSFSDGYELLPTEFGYPYASTSKGSTLSIDFADERNSSESENTRNFRINFKAHWYSFCTPSFMEFEKRNDDKNPLPDLGLTPLTDWAEREKKTLRLYRFNHYDTLIRVICTETPEVFEIESSSKCEPVIFPI